MMVAAIAMEVDNATAQQKSSSCSDLEVMSQTAVVQNRSPSASNILVDTFKKIFTIRKHKKAKRRPSPTFIFKTPSENSMPVIVINEPDSDTDKNSISSADEVETDGVPETPEPSNTNLAVVATSNSAIVKFETENNSSSNSAIVEIETENNSITQLTPEELIEYQDIPSHELEVLKNEVMHLVDQRYRTKFYDFCLICCEEDYEEAEKLKFAMMKQFNLKGCMLEDDDMTLGRDLFDAYEYMMDRSTKVMFYITDNFNEDRFCRRLQNGAVFQTLMSRIKREKCVPLFPKGMCDIPLSLSGLQGIDTRAERQVRNRLNCTYNDEVRESRKNKEIEFERLKQLHFKELLKQKVQEHRQRVAVCENTDITSASVQEPIITEESSEEPINVNTNNGNSHNHNSDTNLGGLENVLHSVGVDREGVDRVVQSILDAVSRERNVTVTNSSNVRIGNQIDVTVVVGASNIQESYSERSASDDSEHYDSEENCSDNSESESEYL